LASSRVPATLLGAAMLAVALFGGYCAVASAEEPDQQADKDGFVSIFNGQDLTGWKANENADDWKVEDGMIVGRGPRSHLFFNDREYENLEFKADVKLNKNGNSGMYFRAKYGVGWPTGYEAQVNNSSGDPKRTGSLYNFVDVKKQLIPDDTWWTEHIIADGNHIIIKINDQVVVDYIDKDHTHKQGFIALQQHDPGSVVHYKNLMVKKLPASK